MHLQKRLRLPKAGLSAQQILVAGDSFFKSTFRGINFSEMLEITQVTACVFIFNKLKLS